jgi:hypothetical protein
MTGYDLLYISRRGWEDLADRREVLTSATTGHRVFVVEDAPVDAAEVPHFRLRKIDGIVIATPVLPLHLTAASEAAVRRALIDQLLALYDVDRFVLWLDSPAEVPQTHQLTPLALIYECTDAPLATDDPGAVDVAETLIRAADVLVLSEPRWSVVEQRVETALQLRP